MVFLPSHIRQLTNLLTSSELKRGSPFIWDRLAVMFPIFFLLQIGSKQAMHRGPGRKAASGLRLFRSVAAAGPFPTVDAQRIQGTADHLVTDPGEIANASSADEYDGVFLQAVALARNVDRDFLAVGEPHAA